MRYILIPLLGLLVACGADGAPEKPTGANSGVMIDGKSCIGVVGSGL
ncbi:hypothetical protein [Oceaniglobus ichthyenteri]|nr:hypothetical protein [Oceaniglobus ichthyenteri]